MLFLHGGGWMYGDLESHDPACRFLAEQSGVQILSIDYRLAPEHKFPAAVEDCQAAYRWLVDHADEVNADPARLAVGGDSAGGSLSLSTAVWAAEKGLPLAFQLLIYPGADFVDRTESRRLFGEGFVLTESVHERRRGGLLHPRRRQGAPRRLRPAPGRLPGGHRARPTSSPPATTRCATRARHWPGCSPRTASRSTTSATPR